MRRRHGGGVDALVVLVLVATILSILDGTFADRSYLVAGLVPAVVLVGMALVGRRWHEGGWWYSLVALVVFAPLAALAALREPGPFLVPALRTVSHVLADMIDSPSVLVSTVPPVEAAGQVMLVPYMIGFLATFPAAWFALATSRPIAPAVPLVGALAATIPLGALVPDLMVLRGVVIVVLLLGWSSVRAGARDGLGGGARGSRAAGTVTVATVLLVSGLVGLVAPHADVTERVLLRSSGDSPLAAGVPVFPRAVREDTRLFRATGVPKGRRLRFAVLDAYTTAGWVPAQESPGSTGFGSFRRIGHDVTPLHPGTTVVVRVKIRPGFTSEWLPMLGELTSITFDWNPGRTEVSDVRYNQATASALVLGGVDVRDEYTFESVVGETGFTRRDRTREPGDDQRQQAGAFLDAYLSPFERDELEPLDRVLLLARYLRDNGTVRSDESFDQSAEVLGHRMLGSTRTIGTSFQYSALMALGASRLGVPARVVTGAQPGAGGLVDYSDVMSWVELQFADGTWRPLDPTRYVGSHVASQDAGAVQASDPESYVQEQLDAAKGDKGHRSVDDPAVEEESLSARAVVLGVVGMILGALLGALLLVPVLKVLRRSRRRRTSSWSGIYVNGWQEVLDAARDRGTPVPDTWSRVAQATQLGAGVELARRADDAVFAPAATTHDQGREFWDACHELRRELLSRVDARHRWWAWFTPASLLTGWARGRGSGASAAGHEDRRTRRQQPAGA